MGPESQKLPSFSPPTQLFWAQSILPPVNPISLAPTCSITAIPLTLSPLVRHPPSRQVGHLGRGADTAQLCHESTHFLMAPTPGLSTRNAQMPVHEERPDSRVRLTMPGRTLPGDLRP